MAYNTKAIKTDVNGNPISQYYNPETDEYEPVEGAGGGNKVIIYNEDGTPNNSLNFGEILDKLDQLTGTVIAEQTRQQNEAIRQQNEQDRIDLYNTLKDLDVSQYELRLQNVENQVNIDNFLLEKWDEPVISLPSNATNGQISKIKIFGNTEAEEDNVKSTLRLKSVRNLLRNSNELVETDAYLMKSYYLTEDIEEGEIVTISIKGELGEGKERFGIFNSSDSGSAVLTNLYLKDRGEDGVYRKTFAWKKYGENSHIRVYQLPLSVSGVTSTIEWIKLEKGTQESTLYVLGKDKEGNILELHSLPNGIKDEINVAERKAIFRTKKKILESNDVVSIRDNYTNITYAVVQLPKDFINYGKYFPTTNGSIILEDYIADVGRDIWDDSTCIGKFFGNAQVNYIWVGFTKGTTLEQARQQLVGKALIYQLAEPEIIPVEVFGSLQSYENGTVYIDTIISKVNLYDGQEGITVTVPIKAIDTLYKVDKETGYLHPLDISQAEISQDRLSFIHPDLVEGDLVDWDYEPALESTSPGISMKLPTNIKASVNSLLDAENRNRKDIEWNKIKLGILDDEFNEHIENKDNPHNITPDQIGALKQEDFNIHVSENSRKHIYESGENVNGRYIKFDDGTMIVYMPDISVIGNDSRYAQIPVPFPHLFNEIPVAFSVPKARVRVSGERVTSKYFTAIPVNVSGSQISALRFMYGDSSNLESNYEFIVDVIAIGRWK